MLAAWAAAVVCATALGLVASPTYAGSHKEALLSSNCSSGETEDAWSSVILRIPRTRAAARVGFNQISAFNAATQHSSGQFWNVNACAEDSMAATFRKQGFAAKDDEVDLTVHFDDRKGGADGQVGVGPGVSVWLHFSFQGRGDCAYTQCIQVDPIRCRSYPSVLLLAEELAGVDVRWQLLVENLSESFSLEVSFANRTPFKIRSEQLTRSGGSSWLQMSNMSQFNNMRRSDLLKIDYNLLYFSKTLFERSKLKEAGQVEVLLANCSRDITEFTSREGRAEQALLIGSLCALLALVSLAPAGVAVLKRRKIARLLCQSPEQRRLRVAIVGGELSGSGRPRRRRRAVWLRGIQCRLSQDLNRANAAAADFEVIEEANSSELRHRSAEFDLVLLCLPPGQLLTDEQRRLVETERWRFRVVMLASSRPGDRGATVDCEQQPMMPDPDGSDNPAKVARCGGPDGASEDWVEQLLRQAKSAYLQAVEHC